MNQSKGKTRVEEELEARIEACAGDEERVEVLKRALRFKASWVDLAEALATVLQNEGWRDWGHDSFDTYCRRELHVRPETAHKLVGSYGFLHERAPEVFERADRGTVPSVEAVDFWRRAEERVREREDTELAPQLHALRDSILEEGASPATLRKKYKEEFFPMSDEEQESRDRQQLLSTARRLVSLVEGTRLVPRTLAKDVAATLGELLEAVGESASEAA